MIKWSDGKHTPTRKALISRLTDRAIIMENDCIEWSGKIDKKTGYGVVCVVVNGVRKFTSAHRLSAHVFLNLDLLDSKTQPNHSCDNKKCINPVHLVLGSQLDNVRDCIIKGRRANVKGSNNPISKLNESKVKEIWENLKHYRWGMKTKLATKFGVSNAIICRIASGSMWGHC